MKETRLWKEDWIGLRSLSEDMKLINTNIPNADHLDYNDSHIKDEFIPFLFNFYPDKNN